MVRITDKRSTSSSSISRTLQGLLRENAVSIDTSLSKVLNIFFCTSVEVPLILCSTLLMSAYLRRTLVLVLTFMKSSRCSILLEICYIAGKVSKMVRQNHVNFYKKFSTISQSY